MASPSAKRQRCDAESVVVVSDQDDLQDSQPEDTWHPMHQEILRNFLLNNLNWVTSEGNGPVWERYFSLRRELEKLDQEYKQDDVDSKNDARAESEPNNDSASGSSRHESQ